MSTIKDLSIVNILGDKTSKHIGAEAENIDVSRNSSGQIDTVNHQSTTESLKVTLSGIENKLDNVNINFIGTLAQWNALTDTQKEQYDTVDITDDFNGVPIDSSLSTTSENPVQNKVIRNIIGDLTQLSTTTKTDLVSAINEAAESGGSGGHTILNDSGTSLTQRQNLQFKGVSVTDDSINERTVVEVADIDKNFRGTLAQWNALTTEQKKEYDTYDIIDDFNELGIDSVLSTSSENPVQNKVITTGINTLTTNLNNEAQKISGNGDAYSTSKAYKVGDFCIYDNKVYKCKTACSAGAWNTNQNCFEQDTLTNAITSANTQISNLVDSFIGNGINKVRVVPDLYAVRFGIDDTTVRINFFVDANRLYSLYATTYSTKSSNYIALDYYNGSNWTSLFKKMSDS